MKTLIFLILCLYASIGLCGIIDRMQDAADASRYREIKGYIRIEARIIRLDNPKGISHTGLSCDIVDKCDPRVIAVIDTEKPNHDFGGDSIPYRNYFTLFDGNDVDSPMINKLITRDICGRGVRKVAIRGRAIDKDMFNDDKIDNFKCFITGDSMPAPNVEESQWSPEINCDGEDKKAIKLWIQWRWYFIPAAECRASSNGKAWFDGMFSK